MAKAALNQQTKSLDIDFKAQGIPVTTVSFEPGYIATRLTRFKGKVDIVEACNGMLDVLEKLTPADSGIFRDYKGATLPW